jgi:prolyl oligopeptidase
MVSAAAAQEPKVARRTGPPRIEHVDTLHGLLVRDPYRWLEAADSPAVRAWVRHQDSATRQRLAEYPGRAELRARVAGIARAESFNPAPRREGGRYFITRVSSFGPQSGLGLVVRDSATGATTLLLDGGHETRVGRRARSIRPSPDGALVAYAAGSDSTEWLTAYVRSVDTRADLVDTVRGIYRFADSVSWARDDRRGFYYTRFDIPAGSTPGRPLESGAVYFHHVGDPQSADRLIFRAGSPTQVLTPTAAVTSDGRYLVITVRRGTASASEVYVQSLADSASRTVAPWKLVGNDVNNYVFLGNDGERFWFATDDGAPRWRVISVNTQRFGRAHWREVVAESRDAIDTWSYGAAIGGRLLVLYRRDAVLVGRVFAGDGTLQYELPIPDRGSVWSGFVGKTTEPEAMFTVQGVADPGTTYRLDIRTGAITPFLTPELPYDPRRLITEQVFFTSKDGTRVPMYVTRRKDIAVDGSAPLWIYGYGAQHWTAAPWFQPAMAAWLLDGGIWAVPNTRGGAEYGEPWFQAGSRRNKQRAIDDYVSAVEWLIANRYTSRGRVVAHTSSAGGVLVAAAVVQRPELFGAAVLEYPVIDVLRYEHLLTGNRWTEDYGTIADSADTRAMLGYAPIQSVRSGVCYPPMLVTPGEFDQTAAPAHAFKFVAALQATQGCRQPIHLRVTWGAGHVAGSTSSAATDTWTDQLAFVHQALGSR